jgi:uncharacterized protein (DUF983 family)
MDLSLRRMAALFWRAFRLRCPNCGGGPIFQSWLRMNPRCPICRLPLRRGEEGYEVGSYMFNIVAAELIFAAVFLLVLLLTWPTPPWNILLYGGMAMMVIAPFLFFPFSKTIFLAFDLIFRPATHQELEGARPEEAGAGPTTREPGPRSTP